MDQPWLEHRSQSPFHSDAEAGTSRTPSSHGTPHGTPPYHTPSRGTPPHGGPHAKNPHAHHGVVYKHLAQGSAAEKAAALVDLAEDGEGLDLEVLDQDDFSEAAFAYSTYNSFSWLWYGNLVVLVALNFFEVPSWCKEPFPHPCGDPDKYLLWKDLPFLSDGTLLTLEVITLGVLAAATFLPIRFIGPRRFLESPLEMARALVFVLLAADIALSAIRLKATGLEGFSILSLHRAAPFLRVIATALFMKNIRKTAKIVMSCIPSFFDILAMIALYLLFSSWMGYILFEGTTQGKEEFQTFSTTFLKLMVLLLGEGNPDYYLPAYRANRLSIIFFVLFLAIGASFLINLLLAVVFDAFKKQLSDQYASAAQHRKAILSRAFHLLADGRDALDAHDFSDLINALNNYRVLPFIEKEDMEHMFVALDDSGNAYLEEEEFHDLCEAIMLRFQKPDEPLFMEEWFPEVYFSERFQKLQEFVLTPTFDMIVNGILVANLITVIIETKLDVDNSRQQGLWLAVESLFGWVYFIELVLKLAALGFQNYWRSNRNRFDCVTTVTIVVSQLLVMGQEIVGMKVSKEWIRYLLVARMLRLTYLLSYVPRFRVIVTTFLTLIPALGPTAGVLFLTMCLFSSAGVELFGGLVYVGNSKLQGTTYLDSGYTLSNFNDFPTALVTIFQILTDGPWKDFMDGYEAVTGRTALVRVFFFSVLLAGVFLILNIVLAFVLEAFAAQTELQEKGIHHSNSLNLDGKRHGNLEVESSGSVNRLMCQMLELNED